MSADDPAGEPPVLGWRLPVAVLLFVCSIVSFASGGSLVTGEHSTDLKLLGGLLLFPVPELFDLAAIAVLGKPGFDWLKSRLSRWLHRLQPAQLVGRARHRVGVVMFSLPLLLGWAAPYLAPWLPAVAQPQLAVALALDTLFIGSLFVLGGGFWDKLRGLLRHD
jgi:hypothetical protein